jgi:hypothetical protein
VLIAAAALAAIVALLLVIGGLMPRCTRPHVGARQSSHSDDPLRAQ